VLAVTVTLVVSTFVPFGDLMLYPLTLRSTRVHEMGTGSPLSVALVGGGIYGAWFRRRAQ
jgi:hypothetical protein